MTDRTVRNWVRKRTYPDLVIEAHDGRKVQFFLLADGVESVAAGLGKWPRTTEPELPEGADREVWNELWTRQGHDLENERLARLAAEQESKELRAQLMSLRSRLKTLEKQRRHLTTALEQTAAALQSELSGIGPLAED